MYIPSLAKLLQPKLGYLRDSSALLSVEMLREAYMVVAVNVKKMRGTIQQSNKRDLLI